MTALFADLGGALSRRAPYLSTHVPMHSIGSPSLSVLFTMSMALLRRELQSVESVAEGEGLDNRSLS